MNPQPSTAGIDRPNTHEQGIREAIRDFLTGAATPPNPPPQADTTETGPGERLKEAQCAGCRHYRRSGGRATAIVSLDPRGQGQVVVSTPGSWCKAGGALAPADEIHYCLLAEPAAEPVRAHQGANR
jgi:hypothetical protein